MTSVGSGSLIIVALLALYPMLRPGDLVGTDLVQAVPLVASAALGQLLFGDFKLDVTASLLLGAIPGVLVGAQISARGQNGLIRRALAIVLFASALEAAQRLQRGTARRRHRGTGRGHPRLGRGASRQRPAGVRSVGPRHVGAGTTRPGDTGAAGSSSRPGTSVAGTSPWYAASAPGLR